MRSFSLIVATLSLLVLTGAASAQEKAKAGAKKSRATLVSVDMVRKEPLTQTVPVLGRLISSRIGVVSARTDGPLVAFRVQVGDRVESGQVIAVLDAERAKLELTLRRTEVAQAEAAKRTSQAQAALLRQELKRLENLKKSAAFSQARLDDKKQEVHAAQSAVAEAQASIARSRAALSTIEVDIRDSEIRAPYAGVVTERHTELGAWVKTGEAVVSLIDDRNLEIEIDVPSSRIDGLPQGRELRFDMGSHSDLMARIRAVIPRENPLTRTRAVRLTPDFNDDQMKGLAAGQSLTLHIPVGATRDVVTVHKDAVVMRKGKNLVYVAKDGKAESRNVDLGVSAGTRFEVLSGLEPGDKVVTRGNERLRDGQAIRANGNPAKGMAETMPKPKG
ncbi:efflux RND transporter periplasmic adaptor subunit [Magnetospira sp. QH-2]|uniref:efflux RND transporter periplasmic adaptor subunit n=1 Tax=Magnetospira sp. (strain QH-2) TaxID=1288970 RepID=UPI0003E80BBD|nr:efflux RND transporter periplasmic adaptor subunit [Magnetospira sp. QH-2]CCQ74149.1 Putative macrolide transporter subunit, membrane fusion protein (MFP) component [Magnetospira sp. QH-2]